MIKTTSQDTMIGYLRDIQRRLTFLERLPSRPPPASALMARSATLEQQVADLQARVTELEAQGQ